MDIFAWYEAKASENIKSAVVKRACRRARLPFHLWDDARQDVYLEWSRHQVKPEYSFRQTVLYSQEVATSATKACYLRLAAPVVIHQKKYKADYEVYSEDIDELELGTGPEIPFELDAEGEMTKDKLIQILGAQIWQRLRAPEKEILLLIGSGESWLTTANIMGWQEPSLARRINALIAKIGDLRREIV